MSEFVPYKKFSGTPEAARQWLKQARAALNAEYSTAARHLYYSAAMNTWITVERRGPAMELALYHGCPCSAP